MQNINSKDVENIIQDVAESIILPRFGELQSDHISYKAPQDPVTIADKEAEKALSERLSALLPGSKVVGEEEFASNRDVLKHFFGESPVWIIDPIDGTRAFIEKKPYFGIIVALAERNQTVAGWLYDPTSKEFVTVEKGAGAYHNGIKLKVEKPESPHSVRGSLSHVLLRAYRKAGKPSGGLQPKVEPMGYACHDYARLSVTEPHFSKPKTRLHFRASLDYCTPWDDAAGLLVYQEAGGYAAHRDGTPFQPSSYNKGLLLAPDREIWRNLHEWIENFAPFAEE